MTTIIIDDDVPYSWTPRDPNFIPPPKSEMLAEDFGPDAQFYLCDGQPFVVYPDLDYATDWSTHPVREVHPFYPVLHGQKVSEAEFCILVRAKHGI